MKINKNKQQLLPTFNCTITILNKLDGINSKTGLDVWKKTVLHNCFFSTQAIRNISGTTVSIGNNFVCRIPKNNNYKPYNEWIDNLGGFTLSTGDFIIKGEIEEDI